MLGAERERHMCRHVASVLVLATLLGCGDNQDPQGAIVLWRGIHAAEYREWDRAPGFESRQSSSAPHGGSVDIYVNDVLADALASGESLSEWPLDSLIVKDGFDGGDLDLVAVMEKRGDGRKTGWYFAEYDDEGDAIYSGSPDLCIDCHRAGDDFVRAFPLP